VTWERVNCAANETNGFLLAVKDYVMTISNFANYRLYGHEKELFDDIIFIQKIHIYFSKDLY
jgi:hypothetical protein